MYPDQKLYFNDLKFHQNSIFGPILCVLSGFSWVLCIQSVDKKTLGLVWMPSSYIPTSPIILYPNLCAWVQKLLFHDLKLLENPILVQFMGFILGFHGFYGFLHTNCVSGSDLTQLLSSHIPIHVPGPIMGFL